MPYESFSGCTSRRLFAILNVSLDTSKDAYVYEIQISMPVYMPVPEMEQKYHVYTIVRRFNDFKRLYEGVGRVQGLKLPEYGIWSVLRADDAEFLEQRKQGLELMLRTIEEDPQASRSSAFFDFLASPQQKLNGEVSFQQLNTASTNEAIQNALAASDDLAKSRSNSTDRSSSATIPAVDEDDTITKMNP
ncbi:hypothetical protein THRCLA_09243 [Thraustotheca clavata]|uniref:PX domain-containing protein n=1 Tax=Thraustotheca clavata TaxID=74557 RepID=A0A1V9YY20_9STRA|nr:hypothetical protein THRCLA_09243 [Thraustotheca clavata]